MGCPGSLIRDVRQGTTSVMFCCAPGAVGWRGGDVAVCKAGLTNISRASLGGAFEILMHLQVGVRSPHLGIQGILRVSSVVFQTATLLQVGLELLSAPLVAAVEGHAQGSQEADRHGDGCD